MNVTVLGASGRTGREVTKQALAAGHTVNALIRSGSLPTQENLHVFIGSATNANDIATASKGSNVIISALGTTSAKSTLMTDTVAAVIAASKVTGVKRLILMSSFVVEASRLKGATKLLSGMMMKGMIKDKAASEEMVRKSDLDWTIVYPTVLTNQPKGSDVRVVSENEKMGMMDKIARADVAVWMLTEAGNNAYIRAGVTIST